MLARFRAGRAHGPHVMSESHEDGGVKKVRVAIAGVGNCASSLVQGVQFYHDVPDGGFVPGLMHVSVGGIRPDDVQFSAAFDVSAGKVGRDLAEAIFAEPNNTCRFAQAPPTGVKVWRGPTYDGLGRYLRTVIRESNERPVDVARVLRESSTDVLVSYLPAGSEAATAYYAEQALRAGCAFVNCVPVFIASRPSWRDRFAAAGLPLLGDDIKSQLGATIVHRMLAQLFRERGVRLDRTYQLDFGGNADFMNMLDRERLESKNISTTQALTSQLEHAIPEQSVHVGPSDYVPWLTDRRFCYIRLEGTTFGNVPIACELKLEIWDSPNSAGVVIDAVRCAKLALERGTAGALAGPCAYFMNSPPEQFTDSEARERTEAFIAEHSAPPSREPVPPLRLVEPLGANGHTATSLGPPPGREAQRPDLAIEPDANGSLRPGGTVGLNAPNGSTHER